jgi:hypothetical protein
MPGMAGSDSPEMALGIGGGFVLVGPSASVESALRTVGQSDAATLSENADFTRAVRALPAQDVVAWGYLDVVSSMESSIAIEEATNKKMIEEMREFDEEYAKEMEAEMAAQKDMLKDLNPTMLRKYFGASTWQLQSTDRGFVFRSYTFSAAPN